MQKKVIIVGSGNAALSAGIAALEKGAEVTIYEKADKNMAGGNTKYTAGAMRFAYESGDQLMDLLKNLEISNRSTIQPQHILVFLFLKNDHSQFYMRLGIFFYRLKILR